MIRALEATTNIVRPFDATGRDRDRGLFSLRFFTALGALASVALGGWVMSQAAAAAKATAASTATASPAASPAPLLGTLTTEQLAALEFKLPPVNQPPRPAPLQRVASPQRVPAPAPAPAAKTGTS